MITKLAIRGNWIWLSLCLVMAWLQFIRGAYLEAAIFTAVPLILIIDGLGLLSWIPERGRVAWAVVCAAACAFEVSAYLLSRGTSGAQYEHPAVSDLVGPLLDTDPGRLAFAAAWLAGGFALLRRGWRAR